MRNVLMLLLFDGMITVPLITVLLVQIVKPRRARHVLNSPGFRRRESRLSSQTPLEIVQERYARGEIELAELEKTVEALLRSRHPNQHW
jgi:uncharacterized membrane protein